MTIEKRHWLVTPSFTHILSLPLSLFSSSSFFLLSCAMRIGPALALAATGNWGDCESEGFFSFTFDCNQAAEPIDQFTLLRGLIFKYFVDLSALRVTVCVCLSRGRCASSTEYHVGLTSLIISSLHVCRDDQRRCSGL